MGEHRLRPLRGRTNVGWFIQYAATPPGSNASLVDKSNRLRPFRVECLLGGQSNRLRPLQGRMPPWWTNATGCDPFRVECFLGEQMQQAATPSGSNASLVDKCNRLRPLQGRIPPWWTIQQAVNPSGSNASLVDKSNRLRPFRVGYLAGWAYAPCIRPLRGRMHGARKDWHC